MNKEKVEYLPIIQESRNIVEIWPEFYRLNFITGGFVLIPLYKIPVIFLREFFLTNNWPNKYFNVPDYTFTLSSA